MKKSFQICLIIILYVLIQINLYPQNIWEEIQQKVNTQFGNIYEVSDIQNVDKNKKKYFDGRLEFTDPYNTLQNCYLFLASSNNPHGSVNPKGLLGIYKNSAIIWSSNPLINTDNVVAQYIKGTIEINNDGKVEIITSWYHGMQGQDKYIWIFSWDGNNGYLVNDTTDEGGESVIWTEQEKPVLVDLNGDGNQEIIGLDASSYELESPPLVYSWNGSNYGNYGMQIPKYAPMNLLTAKVNCKVTPSQYGFLFNYTAKNDSTSKQLLERFAVEKPFEYAYAGSKGPNIKWNAYTSNNWNLFVWDINTDFQKFPFDLLQPGEIKSDFRLESATPIIFVGCYYVQGKNGDSFPDDKYIFENSFKGITLCGRYPDSQFVPLNFLDTLLNYNSQSFQLGWIKNQPTADKYANYFTTAKTQLQQNNITAVKNTLNQVLHDVDQDSISNLTSEAYALLRYNTEYLLSNLPEVIPGFKINLINSLGNLLTGGSLKYYEGGWKDAVDNGDGTFSITTEKQTLSLRMNYAYGSQTISNAPAQNNTYTFRTVNTTVQLKNSSGNLINGEGIVKYYAGGWRDLGSTVNGTVSKELLPGNYSFRMNYAYGSNDKKQDIGANSNVVFQTVNAAVQLKNSQGQLIDKGTIKYYAGGWRDFGTTVNGIASKELLPNNYSFRMTYVYTSNDKKQDINTNQNIVFQTVNAAVQLQNSQGQLIDEGSVKYYAGGWRDFGSTVNGIASKELLPNNYSFRMTYAYASNDKQQNIGNNSSVIFQTVDAAVQLQNSQGQLIDEGSVKYYAGGWRDFATTVNGIASKELLPNNYSFRMTFAYASNDKQQNIGDNPTVVFQTVYASVQLKNSLGQLIDEGTVKYYAGGWKDFGSTVSGVTSKELLPNNYSFRMTYEYITNDKQQNIGTNNVVEFVTVLCRVKVNNAQNQPVNNADVKYYTGGWRQFGTTLNGEATKELLPANITFRGSYNGVSRDKQQNTGENPVVEIILP